MQLPQLQYSTSNEYRKIQSKRSKLLKYGVSALALLGIVTVVYKCYPNEGSSTGENNINEIDVETKNMLTTMYGDELALDESGDVTHLARFTRDCQVAYKSQFDGQGKQFSNIEYINSGYDIFKADPNSGQTDAGFRSELYAFNWGDVRQYSNGDLYPSEMSVRREVSCSATVSATIMNDEKELQKSIMNSVDVGGSGSYQGIEASFTASASFKEALRTFEYNKQGMARAQASCSIYSANTIVPPCMSQSLILMLDQMDAQPTQEQMNEFFTEFGTHSIKRLQFGSKFISETQYSKLKRNQELQNGRDLTFSAEASGWGYSANGGPSHSSTNDSSFTKNKYMGIGKSWTIGSSLPEGETIQDQLQNWIKNQEQIENNALPIGDKEVIPIWETILKSIQLRGTFTDNIQIKLDALQSHVLNGRYCEYLKNKGLLSKCDAPQSRDMGPIPQREYKLQYSDWAVENPNGENKEQISLDGKTYVLVQEQDGYGVVDIGFSVDNDQWVRSTNNVNGAPHTKSFHGQIVGMSLKEQYNYGIIDVEFRYKDSTGVVRSTGWFTDNPHANVLHHINPEWEGSYASVFQAKEQHGYGIVDGRLGYMVPSY